MKRLFLPWMKHWHYNFFSIAGGQWIRMENTCKASNLSTYLHPRFDLLWKMWLVDNRVIVLLGHWVSIIISPSRNLGGKMRICKNIGQVEKNKEGKLFLWCQKWKSWDFFNLPSHKKSMTIYNLTFCCKRASKKWNNIFLFTTNQDFLVVNLFLA